jgi:hypothetical protein
MYGRKTAFDGNTFGGMIWILDVVLLVLYLM